MNLGNDQNIKDINDSSINQAGRDIVQNYYGITVDEAMAICKSVVETEMRIFSLEAKQEAEKRLQTISNSTLTEISRLKSELLQRFKEPAIQVALNETFKEYIKTGDDNLAGNMIDLMIERLKVQERTTNQSLIDEARIVIPKLSMNSIALLAILVFNKIILPYNKNKYADLVARMTPIVEKLKDISSLDIAYLKQVGCGVDVPTYMANSLEKHLLNNYDLFFRHPISNEDFNKVLQLYSPLINTNQMDNCGAILYLFQPSKSNNMDMEFNCSCMQSIQLGFYQSGKEHLLQIVDCFAKASSPYSESEVLNYHTNIENNWLYAFELFKKEQIRSFQLNPVGVYIGIRQLSRICQIDIPLSLFYQ